LKQVQLRCRYFLSARFPSWRFFDYIAASPRIQSAVVTKRSDPALYWQEFRSCPIYLPLTTVPPRSFRNPLLNEFLVGALRVLEKPCG